MLNPALQNPARQNPVRVLLIVLLGVLFLMRADMVFRFEANWDEFLNLSMIHEYARGDLKEVLQTGFVHLFFWLPRVSQNELDQVITARILVFAFGMLTSLAIYKVSREFTGARAALFAVLAYWAFTFNLRHGVSLRTDPLATSVLMLALWMVITGKGTWGRTIVAGICIGIGGVLTIKAIFYVPVLITVALIRNINKHSVRHSVILLAVGGLVGLIVFISLIWLHALSFEEMSSPASFVARTSSAIIGTFDFTVLRRYLLPAVLQNAAFFLVLLYGAITALGMVTRKPNRVAGGYLIGLLLLLLTPLIYRDIYPYFYPFLLAPVVGIVAVGFERLLKASTLSAIVTILAMFAPAALFYTQSVQQGGGEQRRTLALIHKLFPRPVAYIDARSMVSAYPKSGLFMSVWGMTDYRTAGRPVMQDVLLRDQPKFVLADGWQLDLDAMSPQASQKQPYGLLATDMAILQNNYVHYWGPLYVPGFKISPEEPELMVYISGSYKVISGADVSIDGRIFSRGDSMVLNAGLHRIEQSGVALLRWDLPTAPTDKPETPLFRGF